MDINHDARTHCTKLIHPRSVETRYKEITDMMTNQQFARACMRAADLQRPDLIQRLYDIADNSPRFDELIQVFHDYTDGCMAVTDGNWDHLGGSLIHMARSRFEDACRRASRFTGRKRDILATRLWNVADQSIARCEELWGIMRLLVPGAFDDLRDSNSIRFTY